MSQDPNAIETSDGTPTAIEEGNFENLNLLRASRETDSDCEIKYSTTDYEKDSSFEDVNYKTNARNNVIDTETTSTTVKRAYV